MPRPKSAAKSVHTAVRLPEEIHRRLSAAGRGRLAEEIKERLEISFAWEKLDEPIRQVASAVIEMSRLMAEDGHDWRSSPYRRAVLSAAIAAWLETQVPGTSAESDAHAGATGSSVWLKEGDSPEDAGRALLSLHLFCTRLSNFEVWPAPQGPSRRRSDDEGKKGNR